MLFYCSVAFGNVASMAPAEAHWEHHEVYLRFGKGAGGVHVCQPVFRGPQPPLQMGMSVVPDKQEEILTLTATKVMAVYWPFVRGEGLTFTELLPSVRNIPRGSSLSHHSDPRS